MASFDIAIKLTLINEGGDKFTEDPMDAGGATKFGISLRFYKEMINKDATVEDIKLLTESMARSIYKQHFWENNHYDLIASQPVAFKIFDMAVNMGCGVSNKIAQRALNAVGGAPQTIEDGIMGVHSISCINSPKTDRMSYMAALKEGYASHYRHIVDANPSEEKFLNGWLKRAYA